MFVLLGIIEIAKTQECLLYWEGFIPTILFNGNKKKELDIAKIEKYIKANNYVGLKLYILHICKEAKKGE